MATTRKEKQKRKSGEWLKSLRRRRNPRISWNTECARKNNFHKKFRLGALETSPNFRSAANVRIRHAGDENEHRFMSFLRGALKVRLEGRRKKMMKRQTRRLGFCCAKYTNISSQKHDYGLASTFVSFQHATKARMKFPFPPRRRTLSKHKTNKGVSIEGEIFILSFTCTIIVM